MNQTRRLAAILAADVVGYSRLMGADEEGTLNRLRAIRAVGSAIGEQINHDYRRAYEVSSLSREQVADVLVDLKRRIQGNFFIIEEHEEKIVLGNTACPFAEKVIGRRSMCMMTSNVFGHIAAENLGYGKVELQRTIAEGHPECRVVVYLRPTAEAEKAEGREYQRSIEK
jgi:class 3 adenylate cyclase